MSLENRVNKLEKQNVNAFRVLCGIPLDEAGSRFGTAPAYEEIAAFGFQHSSEFIVVKREDDESFRDFEGRAYQEAAGVVRPTACVHWGVRFG